MDIEHYICGVYFLIRGFCNEQVGSSLKLPGLHKYQLCNK